ncbi:hypothetical protein FHU10_0356 [Serratia fonticola]|jgi:hypothetical protein|uniref:Uncharacterized protein n=1 Tax=Serratia fonticola TaxID=47917 RepID=A0A559T028_SERFO|nr:hypothetical protein [Serratia fonticola]TQI79546.1 hypothetical protein FHU09_2094 [Serratia fonticola]TQI98429.1 hypothetical protein FHU11_3954 [Serratia fonticola]TVZ67957.1 hypothetical protein FHU10_0356 [Serratia fonticola]
MVQALSIVAATGLASANKDRHIILAITSFSINRHNQSKKIVKK